MAWRSKRKSETPMTPWEAYQAKQQRAAKRSLPLPHLNQTRDARRRRNLALVLTPMTLLLVAALYLVSPLARVGTLSVSGETTLPAQSVLTASKLDDSQMIIDLLVHRAKVTTRIKKALPQVHTAAVRVSGFNHITLQVKEYPALGYVQRAGSYHVLLASGRLVGAATKTPKDTYPIYSGFSTKEAYAVAKTVAGFPDATRRAVSEVKASRGAANPYQITIAMADGNLVVADSRTVAKKIKYYPQLLAAVKKKGTVDLEVGAFFTPYAK